MWQARRKYQERLRYFRQNVSDGMRSKAAPGSMSPSVGMEGDDSEHAVGSLPPTAHGTAGGRNRCILAGGQMGRKRCLVGLKAKLSGSVKCEERKNASSIKNQQGLQDAH